MRKKLSVFDIIITAIMVLLILCWIFPFWYILVISVSTSQSFLNDPYHLWFHVFDITQYKNVFQSGTIPQALLISIGVTVCGTLLALLLTIPCAYVLAHSQFRMSKPFSIITIIPMLFTGGLIPYYIVVSSLRLPDTFFVLFLPVCVSSYNLLIAKSFMRTLDRSMEEAAFIDGANYMQIFARVVAPLSKPLIAALGLFYGVGFYNDYFTPMLFINRQILWPIQMLLRNMVINNEGMSTIAATMMGSKNFVEEPFKMACVVIGLIPIFIVFPFVQRYFTSGIMLGAVKE